MNGDADRELIIFTQALKLRAEERAAFLERACGADQQLRSKVEALLSANDRLGTFLEQPPQAEDTLGNGQDDNYEN